MDMLEMCRQSRSRANDVDPRNSIEVTDEDDTHD